MLSPSCEHPELVVEIENEAPGFGMYGYEILEKFVGLHGTGSTTLERKREKHGSESVPKKRAT